MRNPVARRYAQALYEEAERQGRVEAIDEDVSFIRESLQGSDELVRFFKSPVIPRDKKKAVVQTLFEERVEPLTHRFLQLLIDKQREQLFSAVMESYQTLRDEQKGIVEARARTAHPLSDEGRQRLVRRLEEMTGKSIRLETKQDQNLIGGLVVRVGDTVYDGSVRHQLAALHERMARGATLPTNGQGDEAASR